MPDENRLRIELIRRLCQVPGEALPEIERFLDQLAPSGTNPEGLLQRRLPWRQRVTGRTRRCIG